MAEPTLDARPYYLPPPSRWPLFIAAGLFLTLAGAGRWLHAHPDAPWVFLSGLTLVALVLIGWFSDVIRENRAGLYNERAAGVFRSGMLWMIFSEVLFFSGFFAAYFYIRFWSVPQLGGELYPLTHILLWPDFQAGWPLLENPDNVRFLGASRVASPWEIPLLNTLLLLSSGMTLLWAQRGLQRGRRAVLITGLTLTILLGIAFLLLQANEFYTDYTRDGLTLNAGAYGSLFYLLTGFHGLHVTLGVLMLTVMLLRSLAGHFTPTDHFALEGTSWYWHFVDVVWLLLFVFVYWL